MITKFNKYKLFENPNLIKLKRFIEWSYYENGDAEYPAITFSYYFGDFYWGYDTHEDLFDNNLEEFEKKDRDDDYLKKRRFYVNEYGRGELAGRIFTDYKIITFWRFPKDNNELKKVCDDIKKYVDIDIWNDEWKIEVVDDDIDITHGYWKNNQDISFIPVKDFKSSSVRSEEEMKAPHLMNDKEKEKWKKKHQEFFNKQAQIRQKKKPIEWRDALGKFRGESVKYANKMTKISEDELTKTRGGSEYFDKIDAALKLPKNLDIIKSIFKQIQKEQGTHFNLILTGGFGDWILSLIKKGILKVPGNLVTTNGSLRGKNNKLGKISKGKDVDVIHKKNDIENQKFIMFDDSYYSGSTKKSLEKYLKKFNSEIYKTYVLYDGSDDIDLDRRSMYRYYDYHSGRKLGVDMLIDYLYSLDVDIPKDIIRDKIIKGTISTINDIRTNINQILQKFGKQTLDKLTHKEINNVVKSFESFNVGDEDLVFVENETIEL